MRAHLCTVLRAYHPPLRAACPALPPPASQGEKHVAAAAAAHDVKCACVLLAVAGARLEGSAPSSPTGSVEEYFQALEAAVDGGEWHPFCGGGGQIVWALQAGRRWATAAWASAAVDGSHGADA